MSIILMLGMRIMMRYWTMIALLAFATACASAADLPTIPEKYKDYHFASETNLAAHVVRAMQSTERALKEQFGEKQTERSGVVYRVERSGKGYTVSCLPYVVTEDGQTGFLGGASYFAVLDEEFKVKSLKPGA
jgi:hypothetical protein